MKVIIDARMADEKLHGISRYTYELVKGLLKKEDILLKLLINDEQLARRIFGESQNLSFIKMKSKFLSPFEQIELPYVVNKYKKEFIFHSPSFVGSPFIKAKSFITIHDLNHLALPQYYSKFHKYYYQYIVKPFAMKCERIFTVSEFSKAEIVKWLGCESEKIVVTYNGVDGRFKVIRDSKLLENMKKKYNLPKKFILYIGNLKPHKNVETLVKAMKYVCDDAVLVINGEAKDSLLNIVESLKLSKRVQFVGYVPDDDLPILYNLAKVFVFPSLYEGFGLPVLEAMASGCPVITSDRTSLPEISGTGAIKLNPLNEIKLADNINNLLTNTELCEIFKKRGVTRAKNFLWEITTDSTIKVYENVFKS